MLLAILAEPLKNSEMVAITLWIMGGIFFIIFSIGSIICWFIVETLKTIKDTIANHNNEFKEIKNAHSEIILNLTELKTEHDLIKDSCYKWKHA